jgi:hypothetical protein
MIFIRPNNTTLAHQKWGSERFSKKLDQNRVPVNETNTGFRTPVLP